MATMHRLMTPSPSERRNDGTTITLQWKSIYESVNLVLFQRGTPAFQNLPNSGLNIVPPVLTIRTYGVCTGLANATTFVWVIAFSGTGGNPDLELSKGERFFFGVFETGSTKAFESQYINITDSETSSVAPTNTTGSAPVLTTPPTNTSLALSISSISASFTIASASPTSTASAGGLSSGAKTGISVDVSLGVVAIVVALGLGFFFYRHKKAANAHPYAPPETEIEDATQQQTELPEETPKPDYGTWKPADSFGR